MGVGLTISKSGVDPDPEFCTLMPDGFLSYELLGGAGAEQVSLTFAVQKPRAVEFQVKPSSP